MTKKKEREIVIEGKTKIVYANPDSRQIVDIFSKDEITKNDNPDETEILKNKGVWANTTTCRVFELLQNCGLPVAYIGQTGKREFSAERCDMIFLEVVVRRNAVGSYLKRSPHLKQDDGMPPYRFHNLVVEFFLKTTGGKIINRFNEAVGNTPVDDPFIINPNEDTWELYHPKKPKWDSDSKLNIQVLASEILPPGVSIKMLEALAIESFLVSESAWSFCGDRLIDWKIEFGISRLDRLLKISDVIDNDSWRRRNRLWEEASKQLFRDNANMSLIAQKYQETAELSERFHIPEQTIVVWRGSKKDPEIKIPNLPGLKTLNIVESGHKATGKSLAKLENIINQYPEGGVIIAEVGLSNGLGPILAARTNWTVIAVPISAKGFPNDVWSSLRAPSSVPLLTALNPENAVLAALNILAQKNPAIYAHRQAKIEELDDNIMII